MLVYDKAHELAKALANSQEYRQFLEVKEKLQQDGINFSLLEDFRRQQLEVQMAEILGSETDESLEKLEQTYNLLSGIPVINEYLTAEYRLSRMLADIQKIVGEVVGIWLPDEPPLNWLN
ncbi:MAG: YlbF family regulator [Bacillota bacterium]